MAARPVSICKLKECAKAFQGNGFQYDCRISPEGKLLCIQPAAQDDRPENALYCVAESVGAGANCDTSVPLQGCYTGPVGALVPVPNAECPALATIKFATIATASSTSSRLSSTTPSSSSVSTTFSGSTSTSVSETTSGSSTATQSADPTQIAILRDNRLATGAVAGIAIGAAIAGAAIAGLIFLFLLQRYRKRSQIDHTDYKTPDPFDGEVTQEKAPLGVATTAIALVDNYLPQPAEDVAISGEMSKLRDNIKNHVQSFYITSAVNPNSVDQTNLLDLAAATGLPPAKIQEMFLNPYSRMTAIRLYLAWVILSRCGTQKIKGPSFLPGEVAAFAAVLSTSDNSNRNNGNLVLSTKWKAISGELLQPKYSHQALANPSLEQSITQAMREADLVLLPFTNTSLEASSDKRLRNLEVIMRRAAQFAFLLFSQPTIFTFQWAAQRGGIVVFPGLYQIVDEDGNVCNPTRVFSDAEVVGA